MSRQKVKQDFSSPVDFVEMTQFRAIWNRPLREHHNPLTHTTPSSFGCHPFSVKGNDFQETNNRP